MQVSILLQGPPSTSTKLSGLAFRAAANELLPCCITHGAPFQGTTSWAVTYEAVAANIQDSFIFWSGEVARRETP